MCVHGVCVSQYAVEMEAKMDQLRSLVEAADRDKVELLNQLEEEKRWVLGDKSSSRGPDSTNQQQLNVSPS